MNAADRVEPEVRSGGRRRRRYDPDRRARLTRAAVEVLERDGVLGLSHRAVALQADVPLGSTSYHFKDLDDLLGAALELISDEELRILAEWRQAWDLAHDLEDALVALALIYTNDRREQSILEYEVHVLAYRRPKLRPLSDLWERAFMDILEECVTVDVAERVVAMFDGIMLHGIGIDGPLPDEWARSALRPLLPPRDVRR